MKKRVQQAGFTLVELAIVLVIIGLLVGGVLVGQDLIKAAEIRAVATDIERFNTGASAFRTKYSGIPGDVISNRAVNFGIDSGAGTDGLGDGDGILENNNGTVGVKSGLGGENLLFWRHLSQAQFIPYGFGVATVSTTAGAPIDTSTAPTNAALQAIMPQLRIRDTGFIHAYGAAGLNYYMVSAPQFATPAGAATGTIGAGDGLSPREALGVDEKLDDGSANRGIVISWDNDPADAATVAAGMSDGAGTPAAGDCYDTDDGAYATATEDIANAVGCALRIRAGF